MICLDGVVIFLVTHLVNIMEKIMKKTTIVTIGLMATIFLSNIVSADDDYKKGYKNNLNLATPTQLYTQECASCHMGYQAEFLPKKSWIKLMDNKSLEDHFGTDAILEEEDRKAILDYLLKNSSDAKPVGKYYRKFANSIGYFSTPIAISELPKFKKEHDDIPKRLIIQKDVKTIANCMACHTDAKEGWYRENNIIIPNYGKWDD